MATDNFNRVDQPLTDTAPWSVIGETGDLSVVSNACAGNVSGGDHGDFYDGTFDANQYAEGTLTALTSGASYIGVLVRGSVGNCYGFYASTTDSYLFKVVSGAWSQLGSTGPGFATNDVIRLEVSGSSLTCKKNGSTTGMPSATDTDISTGDPGIFAYQGTASRLDDWTGANLSAGAVARTILFSIARLQRVSRLRRLLRNASEIRSTSSRVSRLRNLIGSIGFAKQASFVVSRLRRLTRTIGEGITSLSSVSRWRRLVRTIPASLAKSSSVQRIASAIRAIGVAIRSASSVVRSLSGTTAIRTVATIVSISSSVSRLGRYIRTINEIISYNDSVSRLARRLRSIVAVLQIKSTVSRLGIYKRTVSSIRTVSLTVKRLVTYLRTIRLSWTSGYSSGGYEEGGYDQGIGVPSFNVSRIGWYIRTVRAIQLIKAVVSQLKIGAGLFIRTVSSAIRNASTVSRLQRFLRNVTDFIGLRSVLSNIRSIQRGVAVSISRNFSVKRVGYYLRLISSAVVIRLSVSRIGYYARTIASSVNIRPVINWATVVAEAAFLICYTKITNLIQYITQSKSKDSYSTSTKEKDLYK